MNSPKIIVAVIVYDRFDNIREWIRCWYMCDTSGAELVIIHNYENEIARDAYVEYCNRMGVRYIPRPNVGFDIGAFQDVCMERLEGFSNDWDYLLWCTDDCIPMRKDFIHQYVKIFQEKKNVGCVAMEMSKQVKLHIRTTGFMIEKSLSGKLKFVSDRVTTKEDCYKFEHRSVNDTFLQQLNAMALSAIQVEPDLMKSPLWDKGRPKQLIRKEEHFLLFPQNKQSDKRVTFICLIYNSYPEILSSLINQTHQNWELILIHDGPSNGKVNIRAIIDASEDERITYIETDTNKGSWGHFHRSWALKELKSNQDFAKESDYVVITNADNHYPPVFCEHMIKGFESNPEAVAVYCSKMVHSYTDWDIIPCKPKQGYLDCGGVMIKRDVACSVGWNDVKAHSADWLFFEDIIKAYGMHRFIPVKGCLLIHN